MTADPHIEAIRQYVDFALTQLLDLRPDMERATEALDVFIAIKHVAARLEAAERDLAAEREAHKQTREVLDGLYEAHGCRNWAGDRDPVGEHATCGECADSLAALGEARDD